MLTLTIVTSVLGFAFGAYVTFRYAPTLDVRPGSFAIGLVICALVGAACGLAFMYVYLAIHDLATTGVSAGLATVRARYAESSPDASIFVNMVFSIASECGLLLALAAGVFLLAPMHTKLAAD